MPIVVALSATAVESMDRKLRLTLLSLGADRRQLFLGTLWEARHGVLAAAITAYGRVMTEVGIAMMVGGNIKWQTRTITTAIALETNKGEFAMGIALGLVLLAIAFAVTVSVSFLRGGHKRWVRFTDCTGSATAMAADRRSRSTRWRSRPGRFWESSARTAAARARS